MPKGTRSRTWTIAGAMLALALTGPASMHAAHAQDLEADTLEAVVAAAQKEGKVVWYESVPTDQADQIIAEFNKKYPGIAFEYVTVGGSQRLAKVMQESIGGGPTADVLTDAIGSIQPLIDQGYVRAVDWQALGVETSPDKTPNPYLMRTNASVYLSVYNTDLVAEADAPKTYEEMSDAKWSGKWSTWARPHGLVSLLPAWGEEKTTAYATALGKLSGRLNRAPQAVAEGVGAGESAIGYFLPYHTILPTIKKGAPVKLVVVEPVPITSLYGYLPKFGANPNAGKLFLSWLASNEGAAAVERATGRGNPFEPTTEVGKLLVGKTLSTNTAAAELEQLDKIVEMEKTLGTALEGR